MQVPAQICVQGSQIHSPIPPPCPPKTKRVSYLAQAGRLSPKPTRPIPPVPIQAESPISVTRPELRPTESSNSESFPPVPPLPVQYIDSLQQPEIDPILVTPLPGPVIDQTKVIVTLESCTATQRTKLSTLMSRPSHLSRWLEANLPIAGEENGDNDDDNNSIYSESGSSAFYSMFHKHLNSTGALSPASSSMHIFLDRPSAPYVCSVFDRLVLTNSTDMFIFWHTCAHLLVPQPCYLVQPNLRRHHLPVLIRC